MLELFMGSLIGIGIGIAVSAKAADSIIKKKEEALKDLRKTSENKADYYEHLYRVECSENRQNIRDYNNLLKAYRELKDNVGDRETMKAAARIAMINSHPDKSRKDTTDEFVKFKKLYDSFK